MALPGERTDGHRFLGAAAAAGAAALLVGRALDEAEIQALGDVTIVRVPDTLLGLQAIAAAWRARFDPLVVGITGSLAKTSTKDATAAVLDAALPTLKSKGNANNEIGLPITLLRLGPAHRAAVLEMGMYVGGEIATLARIARPEIGVVTSVAPVHQERAGSLAAIERAKAELVEALPPDGTAVLNADDERVRLFGSRTRAAVIRYGFAADADVTADRVVARGRDGMTFDVVARAPRRTRFAVEIAALGRHSVQNALAAAAVGLLAGIPDEGIAAGLATGWATASAHRGAIVDAPGLTILDDTYNASPPAVLAALEVLAPCRAGRSPSSARCWSWATRTRPATAPWARPPAPPSPSWSSSARGRAASRTAPSRLGLPRRGSTRFATARRRSRSCGPSSGRATPCS